MRSTDQQNEKIQQLKRHHVWDVVLVGGGPASSSAAIVLAQRGWSVLVLEQHQHIKHRYGESLPPAAVSLTKQLLGSITEQDYADVGIKTTPGNQSSWINADLDTYDFMSQPGGHGLCVERGKFDAAIQHRARLTGAHVVTGCRFIDCEQLTEQPIRYQLHLQLEGNDRPPVTIQSQFIIDASGRHAAVAKSVGINLKRHDKLQAFIQHYTASVSNTAADFTLLEASEEGWWYSNLLPDGANRVVVFQTDSDLPAARLAKTPSGFNALLTKTRHVSRKISQSDFRPVGAVKSTAAGSQVASEFVKDQILLVGDAAMAFDPLSSQGMMKALQNGNKAGQLIAFTLEDLKNPAQGSTDTPHLPYLNRFQHAQHQLWQQYQQQYQYYYSAQQRWTDSEFWHRRRSVFGRTEQHERIAL